MTAFPPPSAARVPFQPRSLDTFEGLLDDLLMRICEALQLTPNQDEELGRRYEAISAWLGAEDSPFYPYAPCFHAQGSRAIGTTVRSKRGKGYDLDFVLEGQIGHERAGSPLWWLDKLEERLRDHGTYAPLVRRKNRVVRLEYADGIHIDVIPAVLDLARGAGCVRVPDREAHAWKASNPRGYARWFEGRAAYAAKRVLDDIEPLPPPEPLALKPPLKLAVQLTKRARDLAFLGGDGLSPELSTPSIILTTMGAEEYRGASAPASALTEVLGGMGRRVAAGTGRIVVLNPTNRDEEFTERWEKEPEGYRQFKLWLSRYTEGWNALQALRGPRLAEALKALFGEDPVVSALDAQTAEIERRRSDLGVRAGTGALTLAAGPTVVPVRRNTFFGD
jgi:hypothetical protein